MVEPNLLTHFLEGSKAPEICRLDVIVSIGVPSFVGRYKLIELMNDQKDGIELARILHEPVQCGVEIIVSEAQGVVGTVGKRFGRGGGTSPTILSGGSDGSGEVLHSRTGPVVGRIVGA